MSVLTTDSALAHRSANPRAQAYSDWANRHRKWLFAAPAMIFVGVLIVFPLAWTLYLSLTDAHGSVRAASEFVGLANYLQVLADTDRFWPATGRTLSFTGAPWPWKWCWAWALRCCSGAPSAAKNGSVSQSCCRWWPPPWPSA